MKKKRKCIVTHGGKCNYQKKKKIYMPSYENSSLIFFNFIFWLNFFKFIIESVSSTYLVLLDIMS
jgi:hypothetical protein